MLGRGRMRRGVSLEVIVEEDDGAEVTHDPLPPLDDEEDEDEMDDDDDDDDSENGGASPRTSAAGGGRRDGDEGGASGMEDRRRKRERRRSLVLSRLRSVSCETLTLLDTSDMDSCCSEWDDEEDDLSSSSTSRNYVTINRPISRRRILESSQCDSEDSGIEYHSNEDENSPGNQSGGEDGREDDQSTVDIHDQETATESDDDDDDEVENRCCGINGEENDVYLKSQSGIESTLSPEVEEMEEMHEKEEEMKEISGGVRLQEMSPKEVLENDNVVIVETTPPAPPPPPSTTSTPRQKKKQLGHGRDEDPKEQEEEQLRQKRAAYTIRNKEVQLEELPPPHTVSSVRQLFEENRRTPLGHMRAWRDLGRFRAIKSNPSSKILRFDRGDSAEGSPVTRYPRLGSSFTLPRLPSQHANTPTPSAILSRHLRTSPNTPRPQETHQATRTSKEVAATKSGQVHLRKPSVRGFNVKKALQEDLRTFHGHNLPQASPSKAPPARRSHSVKGKALHPREAPTDRSDTESLSSDISEDSGMSNDSTTITTTTTSSSSSSSSKSLRSLDAYSADPSFMWIDPTVMAKIRSVGTTVIFFGPRQRTSHSKSSCGLLNRPLPKHLLKMTPRAAPRIVGVLRKKSPAPTHASPGADVSRGGTAPPGKWKKTHDTTIVYNFTRHKAGPWV